MAGATNGSAAWEITKKPINASLTAHGQQVGDYDKDGLLVIVTSELERAAVPLHETARNLGTLSFDHAPLHDIYEKIPRLANELEVKIHTSFTRKERTNGSTREHTYDLPRTHAHGQEAITTLWTLAGFYDQLQLDDESLWKLHRMQTLTGKRAYAGANQFTISKDQPQDDGTVHTSSVTVKRYFTAITD